ncbi:uncharacterized protein LOC141714534 [Apium graveolens]|uniref:uncharacterized protein LOC141714534 n=1 Tax=Apium graveolens TaxID=4045 RepID=UPI003D78E245
MDRKTTINISYPKPAVQKRTTWIPPIQGLVKLNVDASLYSGGSTFNISMVIRNERGRFIKGKNLCFEESVSVMEVEARGVQEAIDWIKEMGLQQVDIECDSELVVKAFQYETHYYLEIGHYGLL